MMNHYDLFEWEPEKLDQQAVMRLVDNHRDEYLKLTGIAYRERIRELELEIGRLQEKLSKLEELNPLRVHVPALTETVNKLVSKGVSTLTREGHRPPTM